MEILFSDIPKLSKVIDRTFISQDGEKDSPHRCLAIEQLEENVTRFTSYQPRRLRHSQLLFHGDTGGGRPGTQFLVNHENLLREVKSLTDYETLTFKSVKGNLWIVADEAWVEGEQRYSGSTYVHKYPGVEEDFAPPGLLEEHTLKAELSETTFREWLGLLSKFGGTEASNIEETLYFFVENNAVVGATNFGSSSSGYIFSLREAAEHGEMSTSLRRTDIPRINSICNSLQQEQSVRIYHQPGWTQFDGWAGSVLLKDTESKVQVTSSMEILEIKDGVDDGEITQSKGQLHQLGSKIFPAGELRKRLEQFRGIPADKLYLWQNENQLIIQELANLSPYRLAKVEFDLESSLEDWVPCTVEGRLISAFLKAMFKLQNYAEDLRVELRQMQFENHPKLLIFLIPIDPTLEQYCTGLVYGSEEHYQLDQADTDD